MEDILTLSSLGLISDKDLHNATMQNILILRAVPEIRALKYRKFDFDELNEQECLSLFWFDKSDIGKLQHLLGIPDEISTLQRCTVSGLDGLCMLLKRFTYPNRLADIETLFGVSASCLSDVCNQVLKIIYENKGHLLSDIRNLHWLTAERLQLYANSVATKGSPIYNCWDFIDGTPQPICRPSLDQQKFFSGHKRYHCMKCQSAVCLDDIMASLLEPFHGNRHDAGILRELNLYEQLETRTKFSDDKKFVLYGDPAYPIRELLLCPFSSRNITNLQAEFNKAMSSLRQGVEWIFGKIATEFGF